MFKCFIQIGIFVYLSLNLFNMHMNNKFLYRQSFLESDDIVHVQQCCGHVASGRWIDRDFCTSDGVEK